MSLSLSTTYVRGTSHEYVYSTTSGLKISQLDWDVEDIVMAGGTLSARLGHRFMVNLGLWGAVNYGNGSQVDRDWDHAVSPDWSHMSMSPSDLNKGYILDINTAVAIPVSSGLTLSPLIGFKYDNWEWEDHGGTYIYSVSGGWRNTTGTFPDVPGIRYEQEFFAPYLGLSLEGEYGAFFVSAYAKGTLWAWSRARDEHLNRNLVFEDSVDNQAYAGAGIELGWKLTPGSHICLGYDIQKFFDAIGDTHAVNIANGSSETYINGAGTGFRLHGVHLSLRIFF